MSKKQIRISDRTKIKDGLTLHSGKEATFILTDGTSLFGKIRNLENKEVNLMNMRLKNVKLPLAKINELYIDIDA